MKLNKKGFGVAEIAIVVLLIGILAAAVMAGLMGIKKNANDVAKEQGKIAQTMSNDLKHTFPTILSKDQKGLEIGEGEYEVYELGGYSLWSKNWSGVGQYAVKNSGTLYITGNGTTEGSNSINGKDKSTTTYTSQQGGIYNDNGYLEVSDMIINAGYYYKSVNTPSVHITGGDVVLKNVVINSLNHSVYISGGSLTVEGINTRIANEYAKNTSGYVICMQGPSEVKIKEGLIVARNQAAWVWACMGPLTITGGTFEPTTTKKTDPNGLSPQITSTNPMSCGITITHGATVKIQGGTFTLSKTEPMFKFEYQGQPASYGTIEITGGEFKKSLTNEAPSTFVNGFKPINEYEKVSKITIKDDPNDGDAPLIFHYAPTAGSSGWGQYVAEGYEVYEIEAGKLWGVKPVTTPAN